MKNFRVKALTAILSAFMFIGTQVHAEPNVCAEVACESLVQADIECVARVLWHECRGMEVTDQSAEARAERAEQTSTNSTNVHFVQQSQQEPTNPTVNVNGNVNDNVNVNENVNVNVINNDAPPPKPDNTTKKPFGQYGHVLLTDAEVERIKMLRPNDWEAKVSYLDEYIERTGKQYKNHLLTIVRWAEEDDKKQAQQRKQDSSVHFSLERRQTGNEDFFTDIWSDET